MDEPTTFDGPRGLRAGSRFGHYRLRRLLGEGGFGQVWEAEDTVMDRTVAVKVLKPGYSGNEAFRQRLYREARAAGRLRDPHVVPVHQCGEIDGQLYIDMRLIDGSDLHAMQAREGPLGPERAVGVVRQVAAALDAAHSAKLIHRDVKPANILLADDDFACLLDFGLANAATDAKMTSTGVTIGTFAYIAPERLSAGEIDHRTDIYALACVLYECLTGSPPYSMQDQAALIAAHLTAPIPRPSQHGRGIPVAFDEVIANGMAKKPSDRYASAGELARAAQRALTDPYRPQADTIGAVTRAATRPASDSPRILPAGDPPTARRAAGANKSAIARASATPTKKASSSGAPAVGRKKRSASGAPAAAAASGGHRRQSRSDRGGSRPRTSHASMALFLVVLIVIAVLVVGGLAALHP